MGAREMGRTRGERKLTTFATQLLLSPLSQHNRKHTHLQRLGGVADAMAAFTAWTTGPYGSLCSVPRIIVECTKFYGNYAVEGTYPAVSLRVCSPLVGVGRRFRGVGLDSCLHPPVPSPPLLLPFSSPPPSLLLPSSSPPPSLLLPPPPLPPLPHPRPTSTGARTSACTCRTALPTR